MLEQAFQMIPDNTGLLLYSDQGWHYQHKRYRQMLAEKGIKQSMSRKGNCYDNSVMENFFGHLKKEMDFRLLWKSMKKEQPREAVLFSCLFTFAFPRCVPGQQCL